MGTLFRDLRRQFVSFTWMSGVFYLHCWIRMWLIWFWWAHFKLVELTHFKLEELEEFIQLFIFTISSSSKLRNSPAHQLSYVPALPITNGAPSTFFGQPIDLTAPPQVKRVHARARRFSIPLCRAAANLLWVPCGREGDAGRHRRTVKSRTSMRGNATFSKSWEERKQNPNYNETTKNNKLARISHFYPLHEWQAARLSTLVWMLSPHYDRKLRGEKARHRGDGRRQTCRARGALNLGVIWGWAKREARKEVSHSNRSCSCVCLNSSKDLNDTPYRITMTSFIDKLGRFHEL